MSPPHLKVLARELEGCCLKVNSPRGIRQHEAKVNVDQAAPAIQHDVAVVAVLDLWGTQAPAGGYMATGGAGEAERTAQGMQRRER